MENNDTAELLPAGDYNRWLSENTDKRGTPEWTLVQDAYNQALNHESRKAAWNDAASISERAALLSVRALPFAKETIKSMGIKGVSTAIGQYTGERVAGKLGKSIGGSIGSAIGSLAYQAQTEDGVKPGQLTADILSGSMPVRGVVSNAMVNMLSEATRQAIDEKKLNLQGIGAAGAAGVAGSMSSNAIAGKQITMLDKLLEERNSIFQKLRNKGIVVNPDELGNRGSKFLIQQAGSSNISDNAATRNAFIFQKMAREELGLPSDKRDLAFKPNTIDSKGNVIKGELDGYIAKQGKPYEQIREISKAAKEDQQNFIKTGKATGVAKVITSQEDRDLVLSAADLLDQLKDARNEVLKQGVLLKTSDANADTYNSWLSAKEAVNQIEGKLSRVAEVWGDPNLKVRLDIARTNIAKAYKVKQATNSQSGLLDISVLDKMKRDYGEKLTGNLSDLADFYNAFSPSSKYVVDAISNSTSSSGSQYSARNIAQGNPSGLTQSALSLLRPSIYNYLLSERKQREYASPLTELNPDTILSASARAAILAGGRNPELTKSRK